MIKIYSNQNINSEADVASPQGVHTTELDWWMIYDADAKIIVSAPQQCLGYTSSPLTMVVADSKEECDQYIADNELTYPNYDIPEIDSTEI